MKVVRGYDDWRRGKEVWFENRTSIIYDEIFFSY
jgi:hypothetical protein